MNKQTKKLLKILAVVLVITAVAAVLVRFTLLSELPFIEQVSPSGTQSQPTVLTYNHPTPLELDTRDTSITKAWCDVIWTNNQSVVVNLVKNGTAWTGTFTTVDYGDYSFYWYVQNGSTGQITQQQSYGVVYQPSYHLTITVSPSLSGGVTPSSGTYNSNYTVIATATPSTGYAFDHWSGDINGTSPTAYIKMDADKNIIANFKVAPYYTLLVTVTPPFSGAVVFNPLGGLYAGGTKVTVTANAASEFGYTFDHWSGDASGTSATVTISMDSNKNITANFSTGSPTSTFTLVASVVGQGTVSPSGTTQHTSGDNVTLTATPQVGWAFDHWSGDISGSQNPATVVMSGNKQVAANFTSVPSQSFVLSVSASPTNAGTVIAQSAQGSSSVYPKDTLVSLTAYPNQGWVFDHWEGDVTGNLFSTTTTMDSSKTAIAVFVQGKSVLDKYSIVIAVVVVLSAFIAVVALIAKSKGTRRKS